MGLLRFQECPCPSSLRLLRAEPAAWDSAIEGYVTPMPGNMLKADCILGYGEFLHVGADDSLYTSRRGNPFVLRDVTVGMGGRVRSLRPQRCGGGAFTRQYIYASTDRGLTALCHKADGGHTNCRPGVPGTVGTRRVLVLHARRGVRPHGARVAVVPARRGRAGGAHRPER